MIKQKSKRLLVVFVLAICILAFGTYAWFMQGMPKQQALTVTVSLHQSAVIQGDKLTIYVNSSGSGSQYSVNGNTYGDGLRVVRVSSNGSQIDGLGAIVPYNISNVHPNTVVFWNLTEGFLGGDTNDNSLLPAGYYKLTEGANTINYPRGVNNISFEIKNPMFQIEGISLSLTHNSTNAFVAINSTISSLYSTHSLLDVSNKIYNENSLRNQYDNFSENISIPSNQTFLYENSSSYYQYITTMTLYVNVGKITEVFDFGLSY